MELLKIILKKRWISPVTFFFLRRKRISQCLLKLLSCIIFSWVVKNVFLQALKPYPFTNDIDIIKRIKRYVIASFSRIESDSSEMSLAINEGKTNYLLLTTCTPSILFTLVLPFNSKNDVSLEIRGISTLAQNLLVNVISIGNWVAEQLNWCCKNRLYTLGFNVAPKHGCGSKNNWDNNSTSVLWFIKCWR